MRYKTVWISDVHLGTDITKSKELLKFIKENEFEKLYLNGDIIDIVQMKKKVFWNTDHSTIIQKLLIGNHDELLKSMIDCNDMFQDANIQFVERDIHHTVNGEKILTLHGHQFDGALKTWTWLYFVGDKAYSFALFINKWYNRISSIFGCNYWSLSLYLKTKVKNAVKFISKFEQTVVDEAKKHDVGIVCAGHIHVVQDINIDDVRYLNSGCWTEYCSCVVEHVNGELEVLKII
jgi:UDP-2,3-diacylglucosamine pyrophosphatase LpxH